MSDENAKSPKLETFWVLTSKRLPEGDHTLPMSDSDDGHWRVIDIGHDEYTLTKVDEFQSMKGVPFDDDVIYVVFLQGDEEGKRFKDWPTARYVIADVEIFMDTATLFFPNGEVKSECPTEYIGSSMTPKRFAKAYLSED